MKMFVGGEWVDKPEKTEVINPFNNSVIDSVPKADLEDVETAISSAVQGAKVMAKTPSYQRFLWLRKAADFLEERSEEMARTISMEEGKILAEGRAEVARAVQTISLSGEEAKRIYGETIPLDANPTWTGQLGFTLRVPVGVVVAISPFNFPLNLVAHKVAPALAAGNSVIVKPASDTPLSALKLVEILLDAGVPAEAVQCLTGSGGTLGDALVADQRVRKISFTGSRDIGEHIARVAGLKKITMELGSICPLIVMPDADMTKVVAATISSGYANAGQACTSAQRVITSRSLYADYLDALKEAVEAMKVGDQLEEGVAMGPMVREQDAARVNEWVREAQAGGGRVIAGGDYSKVVHQPTVVADASPEMRISCDELFGPAVAVTPFTDIDEAIGMANDTNYGLSAGIFTQNVDWAMKFAKEVEFGNLMINQGPGYRADLMPFGGLKESGLGKEGPKYAVEEMTEIKMVAYHP